MAKRLDGLGCHSIGPIEVDLGPCDILLDRNLAQPNKGYITSSLTFRPMSILAKRLDGSRCHWYGDMPQPRPHCVRWEPAMGMQLHPPSQGGGAQPGHNPSPNVRPMSIVAKLLDGSRCHSVQTWAQATLCYMGTQLHPTPTEKGDVYSHPIFGPCLLWPKGWMEDATWYGGIGLSPGHIVLDEDRAPPPREKGAQPPNFRPMSCGKGWNDPSRLVVSFRTMNLNKRNNMFLYVLICL